MNLQTFQILCSYRNETSSYLKLSLATLSHQEMGSCIKRMPVLLALNSQNNLIFKKILYFVRFMLIHVNENFFVGLLIQLKGGAIVLITQNFDPA